MNLDRLEEELRSQISILEEEESRLKDWLAALQEGENVWGCRVLDAKVHNFSFRAQTLVHPVPSGGFSKQLRSDLVLDVPPKEVFEEQLSKLRQSLCIQPLRKK